MGTKIYSYLHGCVRALALVAMMLLPLLAIEVNAECSAPTNVAVTRVSSTGATLSWSIGQSSQHMYDLRVSSVSLTTNQLNSATAETSGVVVCQNLLTQETTSYALTGLSAGTHYYVYLRQNCLWEADGSSSWVQCEFYTPCAARTELPVTADFEAGSGLPDCWFSTGLPPMLQSSTHHGETGKAVKLQSSNSNNCCLVSPVFASNAHAYQLTAWIKGDAGATYSVGIASADDTEDISPIVENALIAINDWDMIDIIVPADFRADLELGVEYVWVIYSPAADDAKAVYVDDIVIGELPTCIAPAELVASNEANNSFDLSWTSRGSETAWKVQYVQAQGTDTVVVDAPNKPFTVTGLSANTEYKVRVKAVCSASDASVWSKWLVVKTICGSYSLPFSEDFNSLSAGIPACWDNSEYTCSEDYIWNYYAQGYTGACLRFNCYNAASNTTSSLKLPPITNGSETDLTLSFMMKNGGSATLDVYVSYNGGTTFEATPIVPALEGNASWEEYAYAFTVPANSNVVLKLVGTSDWGSYRMDVDNIQVIKTPTCLKPSNLRIGNSTPTSVTLAWTPAGSETEWELTYKLGNGTKQTVTVRNTPEYTISSLTENTSYTLSELSIKAICSASEESAIKTVPDLSFQTPCALQTLPLEENFNNKEFIPGCWANLHTAGSNSNVWTIQSDRAYINYQSGGNRAVLATPNYQFLAGVQYRIMFDTDHTLSSYYDDETHIYMARAAQGDTIQMLCNISASGLNVSGAYHHKYVFTPSEDVVGCLVFERIFDNDYSFYLDNVIIEEVPSCDRPQVVSGMAISATEVEVEITDSLNSAWEVVIGAVGFDPATATVYQFDTKKKTVTVPAMTNLATYEVYARSACSDSEKSTWRGPSTFVYTDWSQFVPGVRFASPSPYPWTLSTVAGEKVATSGNAYQPSSVSDLIATIVVPENTKTTISFDWTASCNKSYSNLCLYIDEAEPNTDNYNSSFGKKGGSYGSYDVSGTDYRIVLLTAGTHTIRFRYSHTSTYANQSYGSDVATIKNFTVTHKSCVEPARLWTTAITSNTAVLKWNDTGSEAWQVALFSERQANPNIANALQVGVADSCSYKFSNLTQNTHYYAYVRSQCGTEYSDWAEYLDFRTECDAKSLPYLEEFENEDAVLCWKSSDELATLAAIDGGFGSAKCLYLATDTVLVNLTSPRLDATSLAPYELHFAAKTSVPTELTVGVIIDPSDPSTYIDLETKQVVAANRWSEYVVSFAGLAGDYIDYADAKYFVISVPRGVVLNLDNVDVSAPASCPKPTAITITAIGENVQIDWTSDASAHYMQLANEAGEVIFENNVSKPYSPSGLAGNTNYKVRLRAICSDEQSEYSSWITFTTPCSLSELPLNENFDSFVSAQDYDDVEEGDEILPDCWQVVGEGSVVSVVSFANIGYYNDPLATSGNNALAMYGSEPVYVLMPTVNAQNRAVRVSFNYGFLSTYAGNKLAVGYLTEVNNVETFVALDTLNGTYDMTYYEYIIPAAAYASPAVSYIPGSYSSYYYMIGIDDYKIEEAPACIKPSHLTWDQSATTTTSAKLTWTPGGSETSWLLKYKLSADSPLDSVVVNGAPEYVFTDLAVGTRYNLSSVQLTALCSEDEQSEVYNAGSIAVVTACDVVSLPFAEDFNTLTEGIPACWDNSQGTTDSESHKWNYYATGKTGAGLRFNSYSNSNGKTNTLLTPSIGVGSASQVTVSFEYKNPTGGNFDVYLSHNGGLTFTDTLATSLSASAWTNHSSSVTVATGDELVIAFAGTSNYGNGDAYLYIDDVEVFEFTACERPTSISLLAAFGNGAQLQILDEEGIAWEYVLDDPTAAATLTSETTFALENLASQTGYTVYVRRVCSPTDKSSWRSLSFVTSCGSVELPMANNFDDLADGTIPECWDNSEGTSPSNRTWQAEDGVMKFDSYYNSYGNTGVLKTPTIAITATQSVELSFRIYNDGAGSVDVLVSHDGGISYTSILTFEEGEAAEWTEVEQSISVTAGESLIVAFSAVSNYGYDNIYLDDVRVAVVNNCTKPQGLSLVESASTSLTIAIEDIANHSAWEYALDNNFDAPVAVSNRQFTISNLEPMTSYNVSVRSVCGAGDYSDWRSASFKTACAPMSSVLEGFEDCQNEELPQCWTVVSTNVPSTAWTQYPITYRYSSHQGNVCLEGASFYDDDYNDVALEAVVALPEMSGNLQEYRVRFYARKYSWSDALANLQVGALSDVTDPSTFVALRDIEPTSTWGEYVVSLAGYEGTGHYPAIKYNQSMADVYIDDVVVELLPDCEKPDGITIVGLAASQIDVQINDSDPRHTQWDVVLGSPETGTIISTDSKLVSINPSTSLVSGTTYDLYVRTVCSEGVESDWTDAISFKYIDYTQAAPTGVTILAEGAYPWEVVTESGVKKLQSTNKAKNSTNSDMVVNVSVAEGKVGTFSFNYSVSSESGYDYLCIYVDQANPTTSNYAMDFGTSGKESGSETGSYSINFTEGAHTVRFRYTKDSSSSSGDDRAKVWNVTYEESALFTPFDLKAKNVTPTTADVSWFAGSDATSNMIRLTNDEGLDTLISVVGNAFQLVELTPNTNYGFRVRSCAENDTTSWSEVLRFVTPCYAVALPFVENFNTLTEGIPTCWSNNEGTTTTEAYKWNYTSEGKTGAAVRFNSQYNISGKTNMLVTTPILVDANARLMFDYKAPEYYYYGSYGAKISVYVRENGENIDTLAVDLPFTSSWTHMVYRLSEHVGKTISIVFAATANSYQNYMDEMFGDYGYIDNVVVEEITSCDYPQTVSLVEFQSTQVSVMITDSVAAHTAWELAFGPKGISPDAADVQLVSTSSTLASFVPTTALVNDSVYDLYVRTVCGSEVGPWNMGQSFKYADHSAVSPDHTIISDGEYPWIQVSEGALAKMQSSNEGNAQTVSDMQMTFVVPEGEKANLSFDAWANGSSYYGYLAVFVDTVPQTLNSSAYDAEFGQLYGTYTTNEEWEDTYTGQSKQFARSFGAGTHTIIWRYYIKSVPGAYSSVTFEDGMLGKVWNIQYVCTSAWAPEDIQLTDVTASTADLSWTQCDNVLKSEVKVADRVVSTTDGSNHITLTGLYANTLYEVQVRSILANDTSAWSAPFKFRTECLATSLPYAEDFEGYDVNVTSNSTPEQPVEPSCWDFINLEQSSKVALFVSNYSYSSNGSQYLQLSNTKTTPIYALLPEMDIDATDTLNVTFKYRYEVARSVNGVLSLGFYNADSTFTSVYDCSLTTDYTSVSQMLSVPAGASLAFQYVSASTSSYYAFLDDIRVARVAEAAPIFDHACAGEEYQGYGFQFDGSELTLGTDTFQLIVPATDAAQADTLRTLILTVGQSTTVELYDTICAGQTFDFAGGTYVADPLRDKPYRAFLTNSMGCDSIISLNVFVPQTQFTISQTVCENDLPVLFGDTALYSAGVYVRSFEGQYCDSIVTLQLIVKGTQATIYDEICPGQSYVLGNKILTVPGVYQDTVARFDGCDSITTLHLSYAAPVVISDSAVICEGEVYNHEGATSALTNLTKSGIYRDTVLTSDGCSEIHEVKLTVNPVEYDTIRGEVREGEPFTYGSQTYTKPCVDQQVEQTALGCPRYVTIIVTESTGLENVQVYNLEIAPNPVAIGEEAVILTDVALTDDYLVHVYDAVGKLVARSSAADGRVPALSAAGIYTVRISAGDKQYQSKLVVR